MLVCVVFMSFMSCERKSKEDLFIEEVRFYYPTSFDFHNFLLIPAEGCSDCISKIIENCNTSGKDSFFIIVSGMFNEEFVKSIVHNELKPSYRMVYDNYFLCSTHRMGYVYPKLITIQ